MTGIKWLPREESNLYSRFQRPLSYHWTTGQKIWLERKGSNLRRPVSKTGVLPLDDSPDKLVGPVGFEPTPPRLRAEYAAVTPRARNGGLAGNRTQISAFAGRRTFYCATRPILVDRLGVEPSPPGLKGPHASRYTRGPKMVLQSGIEPASSRLQRDAIARLAPGGKWGGVRVNAPAYPASQAGTLLLS